MAFKIANRTRETVATIGAIAVGTNVQLAGVTGSDTRLKGFVASVGDTNQTVVTILSGNDTDWIEAYVTVADATPDTLHIDEILNNNSGTTAGITLVAGSRAWGIIPPDWFSLFNKLFATTLGPWVNSGTLNADSLSVVHEGGAVGTVGAIDHYASGSDPVTSFPFMAMRHALGTKASPLPVTTNTRLGAYGFYGNDDSSANWRLGASIQAIATENWGAAAHGSKLLFSVTANGSIVPSFPLELTTTQLLLNGVPVVTGTGSSVTFTNGGVWNGTVSYTKGTFVTNTGSIWLASVDIAAPAGTPGVDGNVHATGGGSVTFALPGLTTAGTADTIAAVIAFNDTAALLTSVTSTSGLTFTQKSAAAKSIITGHKSRVEIWTAPAFGALSGEVITAHFSGAPNSCKGVAFGVYGGDISNPFDANANSLKTNSGDRTIPSVTGFSTTTANDLLIFIAASDSDGGAGLVASAAPTGFTLMNYQGNATNDNTPNVINLGVSYNLVSATQSAVTISDSGDPSCWCTIGIAVKASGATNAPPSVDSRFIMVDAGMTNALLDTVFGTPAQGSILLKGASGAYTVLAPDAGTAKFLRTGGPAALPAWDTPAGGGGGTLIAGGGLFADRIYIPTRAGSGFTNIVGTGASAADTAAGIVVISGGSAAYAWKTAPATPYEYTFLLSGAAIFNAFPFIGWSDGTKFHFGYAPKLTETDAGKFIVIKETPINTFIGTDATGLVGVHGDRVWVRIGDDGTNIYWKVSHDAVRYDTVLTQAKTAAYLGAAGYTRIIFGTVTSNVAVTMMSADDGAGGLGVKGSNGGLYFQKGIQTPTSANTGLTTWLNQGGATVTDDDVGIAIFAPSSGGDNVRSRYKAAPTAPYTITTLFDIGPSTLGNFIVAALGWNDGTKIHALELIYTGSWAYRVGKYTSSTAFSTAETLTGGLVPLRIGLNWFRIKHDGTNVSFWVSNSGGESTFKQLFAVAAASGFLAGAYTNVFIGANAIGRDVTLTCLYFKQTSP